MLLKNCNFLKTNSQIRVIHSALFSNGHVACIQLSADDGNISSCHVDCGFVAAVGRGWVEEGGGCAGELGRKIAAIGTLSARLVLFFPRHPGAMLSLLDLSDVQYASASVRQTTLAVTINPDEVRQHDWSPVQNER